MQRVQAGDQYHDATSERSRSLSGPDGGSSGHPDDFDDRGQKREEATAVLKMLKIRGFFIHR